jgi:protein-disulfide isomerase
LIAKPIVDGLERELMDTADVIKVDTNAKLGLQIARRYGVSGLPTFLVFDGGGDLVFRQGGPPSRAKIMDAVTLALSTAVAE